MNQFLSAFKFIWYYMSIIYDIAKHYVKMIYYSLFTLLTIKQVQINNVEQNEQNSSITLYLKYLCIKLLHDVYNLCKFRFIFDLLNKLKYSKFNVVGTYFIKVYNHNNIVKTICINTTLFDIITIKNYIGNKKTDNIYGSKMLAEVTLIGHCERIDIIDNIANYCQHEDVITLKDVLVCENIDISLYDKIDIKYFDYSNNCADPCGFITLTLNDHLHKNIHELL